MRVHFIGKTLWNFLLKIIMYCLIYIANYLHVFTYCIKYLSIIRRIYFKVILWNKLREVTFFKNYEWNPFWSMNGITSYWFFVKIFSMFICIRHRCVKKKLSNYRCMKFYDNLTYRIMCSQNLNRQKDILFPTTRIIYS